MQCLSRSRTVWEKGQQEGEGGIKSGVNVVKTEGTHAWRHCSKAHYFVQLIHEKENLVKNVSLNKSISKEGKQLHLRWELTYRWPTKEQ